uniref:FERM domain-containing protein n=1 Tax=Mesocestoides corti TaxID=53468 RepID=A0A5K3F384_MESCO
MPHTANSSNTSLKQSSKSLQVQVEMLDSTRNHFQMSPRSSGQDLYSALMERLGVLEADYFDLEYVNKDGNLCWLDHLKPLCKQHNAEKEFIFGFCVKFYAPHPNLLEDEYTRYLFALQIKRDLFRGHLQCSENTAALLAAFIVQAEIGDFLEDAFLDHSYLVGLRLVPTATPEFLDKVMECHRSLIGQTPTEADSSLLDTARKVEMYGIRLKPVKGSDGLPLNLAVSHAGLFVFQGVAKVNTFSWARIRKLSFKRKKFLIKLHPEGYDAVEFCFESRNECKSFWKQCIEHHAFFRCQTAKSSSKCKTSKGAAHSSASTGRVRNATTVPSHRSPCGTAVYSANPSQQSILSAGSITCDSNHHHHLQALSARSLPVAGALDEPPPAPLPASYVQLPTGGSLRCPQRVMLVMQRRPDGSIGGTMATAAPAPPTGSFLVMLPTTSSDQHQQQQTAWLSAIQQQKRAFSPVNGKDPGYSTLQTSVMMAAPASRNGTPLGITDAGSLYSRTLGHLPTARVVSPNILTASQTGLSTACTVIPSAQRPISGRVVYVDSATGRLISDSQLVAVPRPTNVAGGGFSSAPPSQTPTVATSPVGGPCGAAVPGEGVSNSSQDTASTSTTNVPLLVRSRPHGPPPPAPERRDSVQPRERQLSCSTLDSGVTSKSASLSRPSGDLAKIGNDDANAGRDFTLPPTPPLPEPNPAHPYPFNIIPAETDLACRRSLQASCLSLAARSTHWSCQSLVPTDDETAEETRREVYRHPSPTSRSASLHRPVVKTDRSDDAANTTQDDMVTLVNKGASSPSSSRCQSAVDQSLLTSSSPLSKSRKDDRSSRSSRRSSVSGSSRSLPKAPASVAFHLLRELTMTERTYKKDLDVVTEGFSEAIADERKDSPAVETILSKLFSLLGAVRAQAVDFLQDLESRFATWSTRLEGALKNGRHTSASGRSVSHGSDINHLDADSAAPIRVGDLFVTNLKMLQLYRSYLTETESLILDLERLVRTRVSFERKIQSFESEKSCYLPFYAFLLKPMHRLLQYRSVLERLMRHYSESNADMQDCRVAHARLLDTIQSQWDSYKRCENLYKCLEVERDLVGLQPIGASGGTDEMGPWLAKPSRQFIREGLLQKLSKKGYQQRMFFLFSDQLIYASRTNAPYLQFKVHGQFPLQDLMVEEAETALSFTVYSGNRCFVVAAPTEWQRDRWLEDISRAILAAKTTTASAPNHHRLLGQSLGLEQLATASDDTVDDDAKSERSEYSSGVASTDTGKVLHRATTSVHVCWHRSSTFSMSDILRANEYHTSGYLLRKFKNSNGWQKLWVVFTQLCMFFHKSYQDTFPLASLPLLGYTITTPSPEDNIRKEFVFKLQFKNHVYFFRDDSQTSFERWFDCLSSAAGTSSRQRVVNTRSTANSTAANTVTTTTAENK